MNKRTVLFYGDSNTYGYDPADLLDRRYPEKDRWTNIVADKTAGRWNILERGMNGRKIPVLKYDEAHVNRLLAEAGEGGLFAMMLGTNDILLTMEPDADEPIIKMTALLLYLTEKKNPGDILVIAPPYIAGDRVRDSLYRSYYEESLKMNRGFEELAKKYHVRFADASSWGIDLTGDLVHFSEAGHKTFAEHLCELLIQMEQFESVTLKLHRCRGRHVTDETLACGKVHNMDVKKVMASDDIIFENADPVVTISKGTVFIVEDVTDQGVILDEEDGERYLIDFETFENGFEITL